jgi:hypothetical protein
MSTPAGPHHGEGEGAPAWRDGRQRTWGFRYSFLDALVLILGAGATWLLWDLGPLVAAVPAVALVHFFLFCNVFRVHRRLELVWAGALLVNAAVWFAAGSFTWVNVLAVQTPLTAGVVAFEMCMPRYHGVFAHAINPRLHAYLRGDI